MEQEVPLAVAVGFNVLFGLFGLTGGAFLWYAIQASKLGTNRGPRYMAVWFGSFIVVIGLLAAIGELNRSGELTSS